MNKNIIRAGIVFFVVAAASAGFLYFSDYFAKYFGSGERPQSEAEKYFYEMEKLRAADTFGGNTPEETLQLFIDALKAGDIDLASKYFVVDKQEEWKEKINRVKAGGELNNMIGDLGRLERTGEISSDSILYSVADENNYEIITVNIIKNTNGKWKIESL